MAVETCKVLFPSERLHAIMLLHAMPPAADSTPVKFHSDNVPPRTATTNCLASLLRPSPVSVTQTELAPARSIVMLLPKGSTY